MNIMGRGTNSKLTLVTSSSPMNRDSLAERNLQSVTRNAFSEGIPVHSIGIEADLDRIVDLNGKVFFNGYIPADYKAIIQKIESEGGEPINSFDESDKLMQFSRWYPLVENLTAKSVVVEGIDDQQGITNALQLQMPLFIKGEIKSNKEKGIEACLARNEEELRHALLEAEKLPITWKGNVIARELLPLRQRGETNGFPLSREYRVFMYKKQILGKGFYWEQRDPFGRLEENENRDLEDLCYETQSRLNTSLTAVDVGQLEDGTWRVVEVGDPQFCTFTHMSSTSFFQKLKDLI